ncbi:Mobile element protein [Dickeya dianthicola RNS04.9]|nr:Mobile element protein [Dickeya dianthicola RNS04.9]
MSLSFIHGEPNSDKLVCDALEMALWRQKRPEKVIVHTDRCSMSAKGCCCDNTCVESFFHR